MPILCGRMAWSLSTSHFRMPGQEGLCPPPPPPTQNRAETKGAVIFLSALLITASCFRACHSKACHAGQQRETRIGICCCRRPVSIALENMLPVRERLLHQAGWHHELHLISPSTSAAEPAQQLEGQSALPNRIGCSPVTRCGAKAAHLVSICVKGEAAGSDRAGAGCVCCCSRVLGAELPSQ